MICTPTFRWVLALSFLVKVILALIFTEIAPHYDEIEFLRFGRAIAEDGASPALWRAPGYQWFVAAGLSLAGGKAVGIRLLQVVLSVISSFVVYRIGRTMWGERAGLAAGTFVAFYPSHVALSHLLWSETLFGFLILLAFGWLLEADDGNSWKAALLAGLLLGASTLTRSTGIVLVCVSVPWLLVRRWNTRGLLLVTMVVAGVVVVVLPWSIHATALAGRTVLIDTNAGFNLWSGNNRYIPGDVQSLWSVGLVQENGTDPAIARFLPDDQWRGEVAYRMIRDGVNDPHGPDGERWYRTRALQTIGDDPAGFAARVPGKLATLWAPDFFLPRHLVRDWYGKTPPVPAALLILLTWAAAAVPLIAGPGALGVMGRSRFRSLVLLWISIYLAVHVVAYGHSRMHQPLVPLLVLAVAGAFLSGNRHMPWKKFSFHGAPWAILALAAWVFALPVVGGLYMAPGPRHAMTARALGAVRHLPLPGTRRLAWMLASVEGSRGDATRADLILSEPRFADESWSLYLRGVIEESLPKKEQFLSRAVEVDSTLYAAWIALAETRIHSGDMSGARKCLARAGELRPWDRRVELMLDRLPSDPG